MLTVIFSSIQLLSNETLRLEKAEQQKTEHEYKLRTLEEKLDTVKKETNDIDERNNLLTTQIMQLEAKRQEQESHFAQAEQQKRDELEPAIANKTELIAKLKEELEKDAQMIEKTIEENDKLDVECAELSNRQEDLSNQIKQKQEELMKEA